MHKPELLDVKGVAELSGLKTASIHRMMAGDRGTVPAPDYRVGARVGSPHSPSRPVWERETIENWVEARKLKKMAGSVEDQLIDVAGVAKRARQTEQAIRARIAAGTFPKADFMMGSQPMWRLSTAYRWLAKNPPSATVRPRVLLDANAISDAQTLAGSPVDPGTLRTYATRGQMPPPDYRMGGTPLWNPETIRIWLDNRPGQGWAKGTKRTPEPADVVAEVSPGNLVAPFIAPSELAPQ